MNYNSARDSVLAATIAALGKSAPAPGSPRYQHLQIQIAVLLEDGKDDNPRFLSERVRRALIEAIAEHRRDADDMVDIVVNGHHGLGYASDEHVISHASELTFEDILAAGLEARGNVPLGRTLLEELSTPQAAAVVLHGDFDPRRSELGLLGSLSAELTRRGMPNPFQSAIAEMLSEADRAAEVERG